MSSDLVAALIGAGVTLLATFATQIIASSMKWRDDDRAALGEIQRHLYGMADALGAVSGEAVKIDAYQDSYREVLLLTMRLSPRNQKRMMGWMVLIGGAANRTTQNAHIFVALDDTRRMMHPWQPRLDNAPWKDLMRARAIASAIDDSPAHPSGSR
jgi:hypothetical protein